jgi:hypothetical protein
MFLALLSTSSPLGSDTFRPFVLEHPKYVLRCKATQQISRQHKTRGNECHKVTDKEMEEEKF